MTPEVSIVIPYYNSGETLLEALQSIDRNNIKYPYDIIIVNDGSEDNESLKVLNTLRNEYIVLDKHNGGPASARNLGIVNSKAQYILTLDSDNKIKPEYINRAVDFLNKNPEYGVYYGKAIFFGDKKIVRKEGRFKLKKILVQNYIDMCAVFRKQVWEDINGFDEAKEIIGHEDWDFWIRTAIRGWKFKFLNKRIFYYRIRSQSLHHDKNTEKRPISDEYIVRKFPLLYFRSNAINYKMWRSFKRNPLLFILKYIVYIIKYKDRDYHLISCSEISIRKLIFRQN